MKQKIRFLALVALFFSSIGAINVIEAKNSCSQNVFTSEIGWAGSSKSSVDEWLELANAGEMEVNLSGWMIEGAGTSGSTLTLPEGAKIPPRSTYLIANYSAENDKSALAAPPNYINTAVSLSNSAFHLVLKDQNGCQIDEAGDGGAPFFGGTTTDGTVSMVRLEPLTNGALPTAWTATTTSDGFDNNASEKGTPGSIKWTSLLSSSVEETAVVETIIEKPLPPEPTIGEVVLEIPIITEETLITTEEPALVEETPDTSSPLPLPSPEEPVLEPEITETEIETEETPPPTVISYSKGTLLINEFVSDPVKGEKEWVEIINPNNTIVSLTGWKISESSGRTVPLPDIQLGYGQMAAAEFSSGALNNDGDKIQIIAPDGTVVDEIEYGTASIPAAADPYSVARGTEGNFVITETPTNGKMNIITTTITVTKIESCETTPEKEFEPLDSEVDNETVFVETTLPTVHLSELYPNTGGADAADEFIELENYGSESIDLFGLSLQDAAGNEWLFADHRELAAGKFLAISRTEYQFALNNSGNETVQLHSVGGKLLDQIQYENAPKNFTYARDNELWRWTSIITRDEPNSFPTTAELEDSGLVRQADASLDFQRTDAPESVVRVNIAEARALALDTEASLEGIVSVVPNIFGRQIFYLTDNVAGIQIYKSDGNFPELVVGDLVEISGTTSSNRGEPRIKISQEDEIVIIEGSVVLEVAETEIISEAAAGQLVKLTGLVTEKSGDKFTVETDEGLSEVRIKKNTEINLSKLEPGADVSVTGLVGQSGEKYFLLPRSPDDLVVEAAEEITAPIVSTEPTGKQVAAKANQKNAIIVGLAVIVGLIVYFIKKRRGHKTKSYEKTSKLSFAPTG